MKCTNCGFDLNPDSRFCTNCGTPVPQQQIVQPKRSNTGLVIFLTVVITIVVLILGVLAWFGVKGLIENGTFSTNRWSQNEEEYIEEEQDDSPFDLENDNESEEYFYDESEDKDDSDNTIQTSPNAKDFILPDSSSRYLSKSELYGLTAEQCRIARNEIYARHGRTFKDAALQNYFSTFSWYEPQIQADDFQESMLNAYEIANRDLIVQYETEQGYR